MEGKIELNGLRFRAYHGVLESERRCGGDYIVDFSCSYPIEKAMHTDVLEDTLDYSAVYQVIAREMALPSNLLEHVAGRIAAALREAFLRWAPPASASPKKSAPRRRGGLIGAYARFLIISCAPGTALLYR